MGPQLYETPYGKMFFNVQLPNLIKALNRLAEAIEKQNEEVKEKKRMLNQRIEMRIFRKGYVISGKNFWS